MFAGVPFARTHGLIQLVQKVPARLRVSIPLAELAPLNRYAVEIRYPIGEEAVTGDEARTALATSRRVHALALRAIGSS